MPHYLLPSLLLSILVVGYSPGPANLFSLSCALKYGRKKSLALWRGLFLGFSTAITLVVLLLHWLGPVFGAYIGALKYVGGAYMLWLAWHIFHHRGEKVVDNAGTCSFTSGFIVQMTNAKMLLYELSVFGSYVLPYDNTLPSLFQVAALLLIAGPGANLVWLMGGGMIRKYYMRHQLVVDMAMAVSLLVCAVLIML